MNEWLSPEDWLRLTLPLQDRRIILQQHVVYQDQNEQHYFLHEVEGILLTESSGTHDYGHLTITTFNGDKQSAAERVNAGQPAVDQSTKTAWHAFAEWFTSAQVAQ